MIDSLIGPLVGGAGVAAIIWLVKYFRKGRRRKEQIRFLRKTIIESFDNIGRTRPCVDVNGHVPENAIPERASRLNYFFMCMDVILEHRTADLKYMEKTDVISVLSSAKRLSSSLSPKDEWQDLVGYGCIYRLFQKIKWLNLPAKLPWRNDKSPVS